MYYLDTANGASMFREARQHTDFVDKSALIDDLYRYARKENKYIAITKPRRFGKTMAANMLSAFFTKGQDAEELFSGLAVEERKEIWGLRNSSFFYAVSGPDSDPAADGPGRSFPCDGSH